MFTERNIELLRYVHLSFEAKPAVARWKLLSANSEDNWKKAAAVVLAAFLSRLKLSLEEVDLQMLQDACGYLENQAGAIHFAKDFHAALQSFKFHNEDSKCSIFRFSNKHNRYNFCSTGFFRCFETISLWTWRSFSGATWGYPLDDGLQKVRPRSFRSSSVATRMGRMVKDWNFCDGHTAWMKKIQRCLVKT